MNKPLPLYELRIDEEKESFVDAIALVENPAIESDFIAFSNTNRELFTSNDEKMELIGAAMIPNMKIFRRDDKKGEYEVVFSADTVRKIAQVYFKKGFQTNMNLSHTSTPTNSYIFQSYIVDSAKGMNSPKGLNLPDGSWVIGVKVDDVDTWERIKSGEVKGFSVEGVFELFKSEFKSIEEENEKEVLDLLEKIRQKILHNTIL